MFHFHKWVVVEDTGVHSYERCGKCGMRRIVRIGSAHQPVDRKWLETGEWSPTPAPPKNIRSDVHRYQPPGRVVNG
jgi:hypothetical protein